ncbi:MAG: beta-lactamase family protein, partial [Deltaproteobacteria bacterium]|nr:beta-lactamase family protein [Deltaproteobacteria bacterium]
KGKISLDDPLSKFFAMSDSRFGAIRISHLLAHSSGLPAWRGFGAELLAGYGMEKAGSEEIRREFVERIFREKFVYGTGGKSDYSDLGFILLGGIIEKIGGDYLHALFEKYVSSPLGLRDSFFTRSNQKPDDATLERIAPTEFCPVRKRLVHGEVHDDNAFALGGAAGHAGLFSTSRDVATWANELLGAYLGKEPIFSHLKDIVRLFWSKKYSPAGSTWNLGFDSRSAYGSSSGKFFFPSSVGHLGFTGCSVWIDPEVELVVALLTNRVHPARENELIKKFRPEFHDAVFEAMFR